jgi:hypothetical protein
MPDMQLTITHAEATNENGLGPCYRITQSSTAGTELYILPRSALAGDMEMYGVTDPLLALDWRIYGYRGEQLPAPDAEPSLRLIAEAQQIQALAEYGRARLAAGLVAEHSRALLADNVNQLDTDADQLKEEARRLREAEIAAIKTAVHITEDDGLADLRALVLADLDDITADQTRYRKQLAAAITA